MPEDLNLNAIVRDGFSRTLHELSETLIDVGEIAELVFPIDADVRGAQTALTELGELEAATKAIDDDIHVDTDVDRDTLGAATAAATPTAMTSGGVDVDFPPMRTDLEGPGFQTLGSPTAADNLPDLMDFLLDDGPDGRGFSLRRLIFGDRHDEGIGDRMKDLELKMGDFFKLFAGLLPILIVFIGALPAVIAGLVGLAAAAVGAAVALAALGGLAFLGLGMEGGEFQMERLQERLSDVIDEMLEAFEPIATRLAPMAEVALDGVVDLFDAIARRADALLLFRDEFRGFVDFVVGTVPSLLEDLALLGEIASPIFELFGSFLAEGNILHAFASSLGEFLPDILAIVDAFLDALPVIMDLSAGFLFVTTVVFRFISVLGSLLNTLGPLVPMLGAIIASLLVVVGLSSLWSTLGQGMAALMGILGIEAGSLSGALSALSLSQIQATLASLSLFQALGLVAGVLTGGLIIGAVASTAAAFSSMADDIRETTGELKNFRGVANGMSGTSFGLGGGGANRASAAQFTQFVDNSETVVNADSRENANRASQSLRFREGVNRDSRFVRTN